MKLGQDGLSQQPQITREMLLPKVENCPSCLEFLPENATECASCGILLSNFKRVSLEKRIKITIPALMHLNSYECEALEREWDKVLASYSSREVHDRFLNYCYQRRALPYVVHQYQQLLAKDVSDDLAEFMMKRARVLGENTVTPETDESRDDYLWNPSILRTFKYILYFMFFVGIFYIVFTIGRGFEAVQTIFAALLMGTSIGTLRILRRQYKL